MNYDIYGMIYSIRFCLLLLYAIVSVILPISIIFKTVFYELLVDGCLLINR